MKKFWGEGSGEGDLSDALRSPSVMFALRAHITAAAKGPLPGAHSSKKIKDTTMKKGYFGEFGGQFVPELLMPPLRELEAAMRDILPSDKFRAELDDLLRNFAGRETPLTACPTLSAELGVNLWLKREDLLHTGAHKVNNTLGQALLAKYMGKTALVAERARASTAWPRRRPPPGWGWNAWCTWARRTWCARPPTSCA